MSKFDKEEREILEAYQAGELHLVPNQDEEIAGLRDYAEAVLRKDSRINIRISSRDLRLLQARAIQEGIPYQTLVASVIHKYVEGRLQEVN